MSSLEIGNIGKNVFKKKKTRDQGNRDDSSFFLQKLIRAEHTNILFFCVNINLDGNGIINRRIYN